MSDIYLFIALTISLFFVSRITIHLISTTLFAVVRWKTAVYVMFAILFFPGTVVHELSHAFTALLLWLRIKEIHLLPYWRGDHLTLGHVVYERKDPFRSALVGISPVFGGLAVLWLVYQFGVPLALEQIDGAAGVQSSQTVAPNAEGVAGTIWVWLVSLLQQVAARFLPIVATLYLTFTVSSVLFPSRSDLEDAWVLGVIGGVVGGLALLFSQTGDVVSQVWDAILPTLSAGAAGLNGHLALTLLMHGGIILVFGVTIKSIKLLLYK